MSQPEVRHGAPVLLPDASLERVAYAIARVIGQKTMEADGRFAKLDALGRASALHTMASGMVPHLLAEAAAAFATVLELRAEELEADG